MSENLKKTPLNQDHYDLGATMVDFGGWDMPVQYTGILDEHKAVREKCGLFDVSHMGEIWINGKDSTAFINYLVSSDISPMVSGQIKYGVLMMPTGKAVDDLLVYKYTDTKYLLVVNASNTDKDHKWILEQKESFDVEIDNQSANLGEIAIQGPLAVSILQKLTETNLDGIKYYYYQEGKVDGIDAIISRTGYTGEDGFEVYVASDKTSQVWNAILKAGGENIIPCGLGARDTLRFEAKMPLYGHELSDKISPLETGLGKFVELDTKGDFIGKEALAKEKAEGRKRKIVGIEMVGRGVARDHFPLKKDGVLVGEITSGSYAPTLGKNLGLAIVPVELKIDDIVTVEIRGKDIEAKIVKTPFYKRG